MDSLKKYFKFSCFPVFGVSSGFKAAKSYHSGVFYRHLTLNLHQVTGPVMQTCFQLYFSSIFSQSNCLFETNYLTTYAIFLSPSFVFLEISMLLEPNNLSFKSHQRKNCIKSLYLLCK